MFWRAHEAWAHVLFRHDILGWKGCVFIKNMDSEVYPNLGICGASIEILADKCFVSVSALCKCFQ